MANFEESFCDAEEKAMRFLVDDYGFRVVERTVTPEQTMWMGGVVRYHSSGTGAARTPVGWSVTLSFAPLRLELSLDVSDGGKNQFSVEELNAVEGGTPIPGRAHNFYDSGHDAGAQYAAFARLASVLRASGSRFFAGDVGLWADLQAQRRRWWQEDEDRRAIAASEQAFRSENWIEVVSLLEPRASRLSGAAAARLAFAKKRLGDAA
jgi:hypothetical protein